MSYDWITERLYRDRDEARAALTAERALADDLADGLVAADSICSLVAAREPALDDPNREELRRVAHVCRDLFARYREARK